MRVVHIENWDKYVRAFDVLIKVGGTFQGRPDQVLLLTDAQYQALVAAKLVTPNGAEAQSRGTKATKRTNL